MTTAADILKTMLVLLATGHSKGCYARAAEPKPKPRLRGDQGGTCVRLGSPDARHFSIVGAHLEVCRRVDAPLDVEYASRRLLDMAGASPIDIGGVKTRFLKNPSCDDLETWNDFSATQQQILAVVRKALEYAGEKVLPETSPANSPVFDLASPTGPSGLPSRSTSARNTAVRRSRGAQHVQNGLI